MIVLSAGHDPIYYGAINPRYHLIEHHCAAAICDMVMDAYRGDPRVHLLDMARHVPLFDRRLASLFAKVRHINDLHAIEPVDLAIELHFNASVRHNAAGSEVLVYGNGDQVSEQGLRYAGIFRPLLEAFDHEIDDRGVKHFSTLIFLRDTAPPAIILEPLFIDHDRDAEPLLTHEGRARIAGAIIDGIRAALEEARA